MKKLGISMFALMIGLPTMAHATLTQATKANISANTNVATTSFVGGAHDELVDIINPALTQIDTNTTAIAGKQDQLTAGGSDISTTVKTSVGAASGEGAATDTALVTEKAVRDAITAASYDDTALAGRVTTLEGTVGDNTAGLVKDVADNASDISALQTTVGDNTAGLVKDVADLQTAASATKGFAVHGTWGSPTTATGHVNVVDSSTLNP